MLPAPEWTTIKRGLAQRIRALNAFVDDVYHAHEIVRAGIVPWSLIVSRPSFARPVHGVRPPGGVYCHVSGCDLVRGGDGRWRVLEDNVRTPSGISYVLENRLAMTRLMPELFAGHRVRAVEHYPTLLLEALRAVAPAGDGTPTVVVWTPGPLNAAYFEHAFLARQMGVELVEASDLVVRDAVCYMRTTAGLQRVHTIYRRLDDDFIDPLEFRPDSRARRPRARPRVPRGHGRDRERDRHRRRRRQGRLPLRAGDDPLLPRRGADPRQRPDLPAERRRGARGTCSGGSTSWSSSRPRSRAARACSSDRRRRARPSASTRARLIEREPERFIAQELVHLSTVPTETGDGRLAPRHVDLRPFAVFGEEIRIVPGGLTRVALREGSMIVNSSAGRRLEGHVGARRRRRRRRARDPATLPAHRPPRLPDVRYGGWHGQAQQQQQQ